MNRNFIREASVYSVIVVLTVEGSHFNSNDSDSDSKESWLLLLLSLVSHTYLIYDNLAKPNLVYII
jgi:hypothetical protein